MVGDRKGVTAWRPPPRSIAGTSFDGHSSWGLLLPSAPRVEGIVDKRTPFQEGVIVNLDVQTPNANSEESGADGMKVQRSLDVSRVHNGRE